ncbi:MAG: Hsp70 family protein [Gemmataceae bacterium]
MASVRIRRTVGIDLGTTNSVIAVLDDTGSTLITGQDEQGRPTFPSLVAWSAGRKRLVAGREALAADPNALPLASVKRHMGLERTFPVGPKQLSPIGASAVILASLRESLLRSLADPRRVVDAAIITMPAYFNHNQIEATRKAGEFAGLEVVELLHEPTAAAIYYSWLHNHGDATYLVYDLGGGTFDVSIIRRRLGDHEVLAVSGDPFLGGDDFDRLLASYLLEHGSWKAATAVDLPTLFAPTAPAFARLVKIAEQVKIDLSARGQVEHYVPCVLTLPEGGDLSLEVRVDRAAFELLIQDKIQRTITCCHEALARARDRAGIALPQIDHVILVGGSSRLPLVRRLVQSALADHTRSHELLLHEPDLCVAYGAALRASGHGTRYTFSGSGDDAPPLQLHLTSPTCNVGAVQYQACGKVQGFPEEGASVRIRSLATGLIDEAFLDQHGAFVQEVELQPDTDNVIEWTLCDPAGEPRAEVQTTVRHRTLGTPLGQGVLPTQLITKPLGIEVLTRSRQRVKQIVAPIGATLPGSFRCTCRTADQSGRIVVPIYEENRMVHQLVLEEIDRTLPVGSAVEVEFAIDVRHAIEVRVWLHGSDRQVSATIEPPPPPRRPTRAEIQQVVEKLEEVLEQLTGRVRTRLRTRATELRADLMEALNYDDEPRAIQRFAELRDLLATAEQARTERLDPPWARFAQLVRECLDLASEVARRTGRDRDELFEHVQTQERYAEQAYEEQNQPLYRECWDNLTKYARYLQQLINDDLPGGPAQPGVPPEEAARLEVENFRAFLTAVWKQVRHRKRTDLEARLAEIARQANGFSQRVKSEPIAVLREARRLGVEVEKVRDQVLQPEGKPDGDHGGLLEGSA